MTENDKKPVDTLDFDTAVRLAEALHGIKNAPQRAGALQATVDDLRDLCTGVWDETRLPPGWIWTAHEQAEWLVGEARREWDEWQGPRALQAIFDQKFRPALKPFEDLGLKPQIQCAKCNDTGVRHKDGTSSVLVWCECEMGTWSQQNTPNFLKLCNRTEAIRRTAPTQADIEQLKAQQAANRKEPEP